MNPEEAKIKGHIESDGTISDTVRYFNTNIELMESFIQSFEKTFNCKCWKIYKNKTSMETGCGKKEIVKKIKVLQENRNDLFRNKESALEFVKASFDDEGSVILAPKKRGYDREIKMWSIDLNRLEFIAKLLFLHLGIKAKIYGPRKKKYYELKIMNKKDLKVFCENISLDHPNKNRKQKNLLNSIN